MPPRASEFVNRLKTFQMRVADPCTKERLNKQLSACSADYTATSSYYEEVNVISRLLPSPLD